ncbi:hypothetical protein SLS60_000709 [Paraconiothyrium brasiliense]|uniref:BTB domain-containing protein n=1 Tax=Paraconiothyrium brasiliense TaxID=300254 RepID=A0ABR3S706_9PLEO
MPEAVAASTARTIAREGGIVTVEIGFSRFKLSTLEPATFNIFLSWLYTGKIPKNNDGWLHVAEAKVISEDHESQDEAVELARLKAVVFGDRFLAFGFQEAVQKQLVKVLVNMNNPAWYASVM